MNNAGIVTTCWDSTLTGDLDRTDSGSIVDGVVTCFDGVPAVNAGCYVNNKKKQLIFLFCYDILIFNS